MGKQCMDLFVLLRFPLRGRCCFVRNRGPCLAQISWPSSLLAACTSNAWVCLCCSVFHCVVGAQFYTAWSVLSFALRGRCLIFHCVVGAHIYDPLLVWVMH